MVKEKDIFSDTQKITPELEKLRIKVKRKINFPFLGKHKLTSLLKQNIRLKKVNYKLKEQIKILKNKL